MSHELVPTPFRRRLIAAVLAGSVLLAAPACGSSDDDKADEAPGAAVDADATATTAEGAADPDGALDLREGAANGTSDPEDFDDDGWPADVPASWPRDLIDLRGLYIYGGTESTISDDITLRGSSPVDAATTMAELERRVAGWTLEPKASPASGPNGIVKRFSKDGAAVELVVAEPEGHTQFTITYDPTYKG